MMVIDIEMNENLDEFQPFIRKLIKKKYGVNLKEEQMVAFEVDQPDRIQVMISYAQEKEKSNDCSFLPKPPVFSV